jgi:anthranilate/para-aminobenzoate synthase component I
MSDLNVVIRTAIVQERVRVVAPAAAAAPASAVAAAAVPSGDSAVPAQPAPSTVYSTHFRIGAGGAIVYLSDPAEEYAEVHLKTKALVNAIQVATQELKERIAQTEKAVTPSA